MKEISQKNSEIVNKNNTENESENCRVINKNKKSKTVQKGGNSKVSSLQVTGKKNFLLVES